MGSIPVWVTTEKPLLFFQQKRLFQWKKQKRVVKDPEKFRLAYEMGRRDALDRLEEWKRFLEQ